MLLVVVYYPCRFFRFGYQFQFQQEVILSLVPFVLVLFGGKKIACVRLAQCEPPDVHKINFTALLDLSSLRKILKIINLLLCTRQGKCKRRRKELLGLQPIRQIQKLPGLVWKNIQHDIAFHQIFFNYFASTSIKFRYYRVILFRGVVARKTCWTAQISTISSVNRKELSTFIS